MATVELLGSKLRKDIDESVSLLNKKIAASKVLIEELKKASNNYIEAFGDSFSELSELFESEIAKLSNIITELEEKCSCISEPVNPTEPTTPTVPSVPIEEPQITPPIIDKCDLDVSWSSVAPIKVCLESGKTEITCSVTGNGNNMVEFSLDNVNFNDANIGNNSYKYQVDSNAECVSIYFRVKGCTESTWGCITSLDSSQCGSETPTPTPTPTPTQSDIPSDQWNEIAVGGYKYGSNYLEERSERSEGVAIFNWYSRDNAPIPNPCCNSSFPSYTDEYVLVGAPSHSVNLSGNGEVSAVHYKMINSKGEVVLEVYDTKSGSGTRGDRSNNHYDNTTRWFKKDIYKLVATNISETPKTQVWRAGTTKDPKGDSIFSQEVKSGESITRTLDFRNNPVGDEWHNWKINCNVY